MRVIKNSFNIIDWTKWQNMKREKIITKKIDKLASLWVETRKSTIQHCLSKNT